MRLGVLPMLVAVPLVLAACGDDEPSERGPFLPGGGGAPARVFDRAALEGPAGIQNILVNDYKVENIESVTCPADQKVERGNKFECVIEVGGDDPRELTVQITVTSDDGQYQVALPEER